MTDINERFPFLFRELTLEENPTLLDELFRFEYYITKKEDGEHVSFVLTNTGEKFILNKRGESLRKLFEEVESKYKVFDNIKSYFNLNESFILQGEVVGPGIKENKNNLPSNLLYIHGLFHIDTGSYYPFVTLRDFSSKSTIPMVQIIEMGDKFKYRLSELQSLADSVRSFDGSFAEGIIVRPQFPKYCEKEKQPWSVKILNKNYV